MYKLHKLNHTIHIQPTFQPMKFISYHVIMYDILLLTIKNIINITHNNYIYEFLHSLRCFQLHDNDMSVYQSAEESGMSEMFKCDTNSLTTFHIQSYHLLIRRKYHDAILYKCINISIMFYHNYIMSQRPNQFGQTKLTMNETTDTSLQ